MMMLVLLLASNVYGVCVAMLSTESNSSFYRPRLVKDVYDTPVAQFYEALDFYYGDVTLVIPDRTVVDGKLYRHYNTNSPVQLMEYDSSLSLECERVLQSLPNETHSIVPADRFAKDNIYLNKVHRVSFVAPTKFCSDSKIRNVLQLRASLNVYFLAQDCLEMLPPCKDDAFRVRESSTSFAHEQSDGGSWAPS